MAITDGSSAQGLRVVVTRKVHEADGVVGLELRAADGGGLPEFTAGAHIDVTLPNGAVRQYSLCNDPAERHRYQLGILLEPEGRGGSRSAHEDLAEGDELWVGQPRNQFPLVPARHTILVAGGIGVTPLLSMAEVLCRQGASFELHYCTRSRSRTAFLPRLREAAYAGRVALHFDDEDPGQRFDARALLTGADPHAHLYVCGPKGFMDYVTGTAAELGWADPRVHVEYFAGAPVAAADDGGFEVELASSGLVVRVGAEQSVAAALIDSGIQVPLSCEQGICGTCAMRVLEGEPDHRDMYFSEAEHADGYGFTPCCSRAKSARLVLDF